MRFVTNLPISVAFVERIPFSNLGSRTWQYTSDKISFCPKRIPVIIHTQYMCIETMKKKDILFAYSTMEKSSQSHKNWKHINILTFCYKIVDVYWTLVVVTYCNNLWTTTLDNKVKMTRSDCLSLKVRVNPEAFFVQTILHLITHVFESSMSLRYFAVVVLYCSATISRISRAGISTPFSRNNWSSAFDDSNETCLMGQQKKR